MPAAVEIVRTAFAAYLAGELDEVFAHADEAVEFRPAYHDRGPFIGADEVRRFFEQARYPRARWWPVAVDFEQVGTQVLVFGRMGMAAFDGQPLELPVAWIFDLDGEVITRMTGFIDERHARAALKP